MPAEIHLALTKVSFALHKSGIQLVWRPSARFGLGNRRGLEYTRNTAHHLTTNLPLFLSLYFLNQTWWPTLYVQKNLLGCDGIFLKLIPRK